MHIHDFRLTLIGACTALAPIAKPHNDANEALRFVCRAEYLRAFRDIRGEAPFNRDLRHPWHHSQRNSFWEKYLGCSPGSLSANEAWQRVVPFRLAHRPGEVLIDSEDMRITYDCFGYPHGIATAINIRCFNRDLTLEGWVEQARILRRRKIFRIDWQNGVSQGDMTLEGVLNTLMDKLHARYYGTEVGKTSTSEPFSLMTVVQGEGVALDQSVDEPMHRALHAVTAWPQKWMHAQLPPLNAAALPMKSANAVPSACVYATGRGHTIWIPSLFDRADGDPPLHSLSCYHRNMVAGGMQVESFLGFCAAFDQANQKMKNRIKEYLEPIGIAEALAGFVSGSDNYRSAGLRRLIGEHGARSHVNALFDTLSRPQIQFD